MNQGEIGVQRAIKLKELKDQVIVITGASSGIGLVTARMAAAKGAKLVLAARNEAALKELTEELREAGHEAVYVRADVGIEEDVNMIAETALKSFGRFDTWVNNAGVSIYGKAMDVSYQDMKRLFATNYWGVVYGSRVTVHHFRERRIPGALINIGSVFGDKGTLVQSTYASSKFAIHGWTESLRMEMDREKAPVSITLIHPGRVDTPYNEHARSYLVHQPVHKGMIYPPEAVAEAILYAASHPKRDIYVGSQAKMLQLLGANFPSLTDKFWEGISPRTQYDEKRKSNSPEESNLYHAGYGMHERGTNLGWKRKRSMFVKAAKHPVLTRVIVAGICVWAVLKIK
ncbi:SDR family oxidoreductase [Terribacillus saccharophilus]|uniref:Oxidoreductase n=1 Tax=Terribacillus saccharophilus TaxID=361277 RepID=A0A268AAL9_9BACI|nr:SDR family oxidoreductase [Terribacillus saccharophilus]PAD21168.1 oxidoreductase [Terribacillus saccharophilus]PAF34516.1 oxidoreductase [Terribacillus saccharophilus]PAF36195.1 oxidoreductase [Terribacillus saccharophilus]